MNEAVFIAAVLFEKGILNKGEAIALVKMSQKETFSASLSEMIAKVGEALRTNQRRKIVNNLDEIDAIDLMPSRR